MHYGPLAKIRDELPKASGVRTCETAVEADEHASKEAINVRNCNPNRDLPKDCFRGILGLQRRCGE